LTQQRSAIFLFFWSYQISRNPDQQTNDEIDLTEREDCAVFHRNPWSIAKLNAATTRNRQQQQQQQQQSNHMSILPLAMPLRVLTTEPGSKPTLQPHLQQKSQVASVSNYREKVMRTETESGVTKEGTRKESKIRSDASGIGRQQRLKQDQKEQPSRLNHHSMGTFPIAKSFQNCKSKAIVPKSVPVTDIMKSKICLSIRSRERNDPNFRQQTLKCLSEQTRVVTSLLDSFLEALLFQGVTVRTSMCAYMLFQEVMLNSHLT
jgi:hypothetical protein